MCGGKKKAKVRKKWVCCMLQISAKNITWPDWASNAQQRQRQILGCWSLKVEQSLKSDRQNIWNFQLIQEQHTLDLNLNLIKIWGTHKLKHSKVALDSEMDKPQVGQFRGLPSPKGHAEGGESGSQLPSRSQGYSLLQRRKVGQWAQPSPARRQQNAGPFWCQSKKHNHNPGNSLRDKKTGENQKEKTHFLAIVEYILVQWKQIRY